MFFLNLDTQFQFFLKAAETIVSEDVSFKSKVKDFAILFKLRLAVLVVLSSALGYLMAVESVNWLDLSLLVAGGFLLTGSANSFNQIWEKETDRLMERTQGRPLPQGRMSAAEALLAGSITGISGIALLWFLLNPLSGVLGTISLFFYVFLYTPLKSISALSVFIGAFPGAIPPMLGYVAGSGKFGLEPGLLFAVQFMWQFPHFWAIAWVADDDYKRAGFNMLPFREGRSRRSALQIVAYSLFLIPVSLLPWIMPNSSPMIGNLAAVISIAAGLLFAWYAYRLYITLQIKEAKRLMFASFIYLPIVQLSYVIDKL